MKNLLKIIGVIFAATLLSACLTAPVAKKVSSTGKIIVANKTGWSFKNIWVVSCSGSGRSFNRLAGKKNYLRNGFQHSFRISTGCWDVRVDLITGRSKKQRIYVKSGFIHRYTISKKK